MSDALIEYAFLPVPAPEKSKPEWDIDAAIATYNVEGWGNGYFSVNAAGNVVSKPLKEDGGTIDLLEVVQDIAHLGRALEVELFGSEIHALFHATHHLVRATRKEQHDFVDHRAVFVLRLRENTRCLTPFDVVVETRPLRHLGGHVVVTAPHREDSLHHVE